MGPPHRHTTQRAKDRDVTLWSDPVFIQIGCTMVVIFLLVLAIIQLLQEEDGRGRGTSATAL
jgi:hypothetical protein|eukprot:COSAG01_NODE_3919_length_5537_cov_3.626333_10_plen_62_part_00